ncbi:MAG: 4-hydroxy-3-methylbut-2-enyl diphosphate reductase, partial [Candidatus Omnitrophica bacterium]|nr:4-hydroxy-3-methylbut-2-enyl diphosphate reductase [Candidatus Omnitrophota bacterium]
PTRIKQEEIKSLPKENSVVIIIGSKTSANTKRLYEISHSINPRSYRVNSSGEIKKSWLKGAESVGITAGASTPESSIKEVTKKLESIHPF